MKKIIPLMIAILVVISAITIVYASSYKVELSFDKTDINPKDEFTMDVKISNIEDDNGFITFGATIKYDKNVLTLTKIQNQSNWTEPTFNENNGKFITDRNGPTKSSESVVKVTFKANDNASGDTTVSVEDIETSNGANDITTSNVSSTIKIGAKNTVVNNTVNNTLNNVVKNTTNNTVDNKVNNVVNKITTKNNVSDNDTVKAGILPKAGNEDPTLTLAVILLVLVIVFYIRFEVISAKINKLK